VIHNCMNDAIEHGKIAIFASINTENELPKLESSIKSFDKKLASGSLRIVDLSNCAKGAISGELSMMEEASKKSIDDELKIVEDEVRANGAIVVANCSEELSMNEKYEECNILEKSLQDVSRSWVGKGLRVLIICPHLSTVLDEREKATLAIHHTATLKADTETSENKKRNRWATVDETREVMSRYTC
jgi:hypothetical protein